MSYIISYVVLCRRLCLYIRGQHPPFSPLLLAPFLMIFRFCPTSKKSSNKNRKMMPTGSQNGAKMSYFSHFCPQKSMKNPSRFSDVEKIAPGTKNDEMFIPSDPQNHKKTTVKHMFFWYFEDPGGPTSSHFRSRERLFRCPKIDSDFSSIWEAKSAKS